MREGKLSPTSVKFYRPERTAHPPGIMTRRSCAIYATGIVCAHLLIVGIALVVAQVFQTMIHSRLKKVSCTFLTWEWFQCFPSFHSFFQLSHLRGLNVSSAVANHAHSASPRLYMPGHEIIQCLRVNCLNFFCCFLYYFSGNSCFAAFCTSSSTRSTQRISPHESAWSEVVQRVSPITCLCSFGFLGFFFFFVQACIKTDD